MPRIHSRNAVSAEGPALEAAELEVGVRVDQAGQEDRVAGGERLGRAASAPPPRLPPRRSAHPLRPAPPRPNRRAVEREGPGAEAGAPHPRRAGSFHAAEGCQGHRSVGSVPEEELVDHQVPGTERRREVPGGLVDVELDDAVGSPKKKTKSRRRGARRLSHHRGPRRRGELATLRVRLITIFLSNPIHTP